MDFRFGLAPLDQYLSIRLIDELFEHLDLYGLNLVEAAGPKFEDVLIVMGEAVFDLDRRGISGEVNAQEIVLRLR